MRYQWIENLLNCLGYLKFVGEDSSRRLNNHNVIACRQLCLINDFLITAYFLVANITFYQFTRGSE